MTYLDIIKVNESFTKYQFKSPGRFFGVFVALIMTLTMSLSVAQAATNETIIADRHKGLALFGYDPLSYWVEGRERLGRTDISAPYAGLFWNFRNIGNRDAFLDRPDFYMPVFGGYCPVGISRGYPTAGSPLIWHIYKGKLYFFYSEANKAVFLYDPEFYSVMAEKEWPLLKNDLTF
jgi:hypothetical protein